MHVPWPQMRAMSFTDTEARSDQCEGGLSVAERHKRLGYSEASGDVAVLTHQVLAIAHDLAAPAT